MRAHCDETGAKRRTSMNPDNTVSLAVTLLSDSLHRHDESQRGSPTRQLSVIPQQPAFSVSACSTASHSSDSHLHTRSIARIGLSYGQISLGEPSPGAIPSGRNDAMCISPHDALMSLNASPRGPIPRATYQRTTSNDGPLASPRKPTEASRPDEHKILRGFLCDCCPKKPKKFTSAEELASHEAEKPHECSFCGNRFKNKNEAERHQNSVHVRGKSCSCSALNGYDQAFHDSTNRPGEADSCGFCGEEFLKEGRGSGDHASHHGTEQDWDERVYHLREVHKFRECNSSKKFFRADHFRQHLKHSHAGTSGTWTNALENACILIEDSAAR
ncbi:C2H2 finger domain-containing protein [Colletotrichum scovillei]|nr:C2H2 finger domain-containing protein [Colletotrichum scovillei]